MYYRANPNILSNARLLRKNMTEAEIKLWEYLNNRQLNGLKFRRQHPIDIFIADFYCHEARLVIEIDGPVHSGQTEYDNGREADIEKYDIKVIRFTNEKVLSGIKHVIKEIKESVTEMILKSPSGGFRGKNSGREQ